MGDSTTIALNLTFFGTLGLAFLMFVGLFLLVVLTLLLAGAGRLLVLTVMTVLGRRPRNETLPLVHLTGEPGPPSDAPGLTHDDGAAATATGRPARGGVLRAKAGALRGWGKALRGSRDFLKPSGLRPRFHYAVVHHPLLTAVGKEPPVLAEDWAAAVAEADARAMARARAAAREIKVSGGDLPGPSVPAANVEAVAPLVESALHRDIPGRDKTGRDTASPDNAAQGAARSFTRPPAPAPLSLLDTGSLVSLSGHARVLKAKLPADDR